MLQNHPKYLLRIKDAIVRDKIKLEAGFIITVKKINLKLYGHNVRANNLYIIFLHASTFGRRRNGSQWMNGLTTPMFGREDHSKSHGYWDARETYGDRVTATPDYAKNTALTAVADRGDYDYIKYYTVSLFIVENVYDFCSFPPFSSKLRKYLNKL